MSERRVGEEFLMTDSALRDETVFLVLGVELGPSHHMLVPADGLHRESEVCWLISNNVNSS